MHTSKHNKKNAIKVNLYVAEHRVGQIVEVDLEKIIWGNSVNPYTHAKDSYKTLS